MYYLPCKNANVAAKSFSTKIMPVQHIYRRWEVGSYQSNWENKSHIFSVVNTIKCRDWQIIGYVVVVRNYFRKWQWRRMCMCKILGKPDVKFNLKWRKKSPCLLQNVNNKSKRRPTFQPAIANRSHLTRKITSSFSGWLQRWQGFTWVFKKVACEFL